MSTNPTTPSDNTVEAIRDFLVKGDYRTDTNVGLNRTAQAIHSLTTQAKQKMAMCTDDKTFLEEHKYANVIEYDTKLKRPSRAIYFNRQWEAEKQGLDTLAAFSILTEEDTESQL